MLTDTPSFQGAAGIPHRRPGGGEPAGAAQRTSCYDTYQVAEARAWGADCILIIMAGVDDALARDLLDANPCLWHGCHHRGA